MATRKKPANHRLELISTWMFGCLLLLIANVTIFKRMDASVGEPWLNILLSAAVLILFTIIIITLYRLHKEVKLANSRISHLDEVDDSAFAEYIADFCSRNGWTAEYGQAHTLGAILYLEKEGIRVVALFHIARRHLTKSYIAAAASYCRNHPHPTGVAFIWSVTNTKFTRQARREAARSGLRLIDRSTLINRLAKNDLFQLT